MLCYGSSRNVAANGLAEYSQIRNTHTAVLRRPRRCQEQAEDILVPSLLRNCLTLYDISFS